MIQKPILKMVLILKSQQMLQHQSPEENKTSINSVRDVETGAARIESNSGNSFSDGDQLNHNYGMNIKNPVQYGAHLAGVDTVEGDSQEGGVVDNEGKKVHFDKDTWADLEKNGFAEKAENGNWKVTEDRHKVEGYLSSA